MTDRPPVTGRLLFGLVVLTLGVLWTLDRLGLTDASQVVRWWPLLALAWGVIRLTGFGVRRRPMVGQFWIIVGGIALLHTLGWIRATILDLWPVLLIAVGASLVLRAWRGSAGTGAAGEGGSGLNAFAFMAGAERKVVTQEFRGGDVSAVLGGSTVDFRAARLAENPAVLDVFAMWGGIEVLVPPGWRVVGEVTPILGALVDSTAPPTDPSAPTLVVRGLVLMGGVEVRNEARRRGRYEYVDVDPGGGKRGVRVGPGGVVIGAVVGERGGEGSQSQQKIYGVRITKKPGGIEVTREPWPAPPAGAPPAEAPPAAKAAPGQPDPPPGPTAADPE